MLEFRMLAQRSDTIKTWQMHTFLREVAHSSFWFLLDFKVSGLLQADKANGSCSMKYYVTPDHV